MLENKVRIKCRLIDKQTKKTMGKTRTDVDVRAFLRSTVFGRVDEGALDFAVAHARAEYYEQPELLNAVGQTLHSIRLVVDGGVGLMARHPNGREVVVSEIGRGQWATWLPCFMAQPPEYDFIAYPGSLLIAMPVVQVQHCCRQYPALYPLIIAEIGERFRHLMAWASQSIFLEPIQRMAKLIVILAKAQNMVGNSGTIDATQQRLAVLARCSRQSANALLVSLEAQGLIALTYGKCTVVDLERLDRFASAEHPT